MPTTTHGSPLPPDLLNQVRDHFHYVDYCPIIEKPRIFLESGGGSLKLKAAIERSTEVAALPDQEGRDNDASRHITAILNQGRADLRDYFGSQDGSVISGETGTILLYRVIRAIALSAPPGPIVSCNLEHPASFDAARQWARDTGRYWKEVAFDPLSGKVEAADYAKTITPDTQIATVIHTSQLTGLRVDLTAICAAIRAIAPECFIIVDGIQHAPHGALNVAEYGADAYVFSPYKAFSRLACGFAWLSPRMVKVPHEYMLGKSADIWELGSRDPGFYASQSAVIDYYSWLGGHFTNATDRRQRLIAAGQAMGAHETHLIGMLLFGDGNVPGLTDNPNIAVIGPSDTANREGIVSFTLRGTASPDLVRQLAKRGIRVHARIDDAYSGHILSALSLPDCLRVSLAHYNSPEEVRTLLTAIAEIAGAT
ncbi:MAG: aminotransferase class V-fold PLP-dependent enzyme [Alphaproteobacteria bacterium]